MTATTPQPSATELWEIINREITGIQLLWEAVDGLYFQPQGKGLATLGQDAPLFFRLMQTAFIESLLMRVSRLMDPANSGRREGERPNLSLKRLVEKDSRICLDEKAIRAIWDGSGLKTVRDKYLSHNDLNRALKEAHTLNIPLETADIEAMQALASGLRELRRSVNHKLTGTAYLDERLDVQVQHELRVLSKSLLGGEQFFTLLPDHEFLQRAWQEAGHE
ncbi:hypothetical protein [Aromatoleum bremense]|uniref:HEPN AbiU2-like domain-containing protein n=1 Tax=Aromatoleum bremense TaxID=76115 RepID=A0ABX1NV24_9RHOO|nr:hypothetical protein [Aromatoleum bremense]NMG15758.1 hypothetical protein [Aromatoleum bremense]QTQ30042.1 Uncharacterized protein pbN1_00500 [Aromatoleum bremense]